MPGMSFFLVYPYYSSQPQQELGEVINLGSGDFVFVQNQKGGIAPEQNSNLPLRSPFYDNCTSAAREETQGCQLNITLYYDIMDG